MVNPILRSTTYVPYAIPTEHPQQISSLLPPARLMAPRGTGLSPVQEAQRYTDAIAAIAKTAHWRSDSQIIDALSALDPSFAAIDHLWSTGGGKLRAELIQSFGKIAASHPSAVLPGKAYPAELAAWRQMTPDQLRSELTEKESSLRSAGFRLPPTGDLSGLGKEALVQKLADRVALSRSAPLGFQAAVLGINDAIARGAPKASVAALAQKALDQYGSQPLALKRWLSELAAGRG